MASPQSPKTVNNILTVLNVLLRKAVEWEAIERMPRSIKLLPVTKGSTAFHDFDEYERLIEAAQHTTRARTSSCSSAAMRDCGVEK